MNGSIPAVLFDQIIARMVQIHTSYKNPLFVIRMVSILQPLQPSVSLLGRTANGFTSS